MSVPSKKGAQAPPGDRETTLFRLYVADETPNSARAMANLKLICQEHLRGRYRLEVVDILQEPLRALSEGVLVTPTLIRLLPLPVRRIVGDLSEPAAVLRTLGLEEG
jgi:circadian clock protein KaiB